MFFRAANETNEVYAFARTTNSQISETNDSLITANGERVAGG